jgi:hypothetical protein
MAECEVQKNGGDVSHRPKYASISIIVDPSFQRHVNRVAFPFAEATITNVASTRKEIAKFVERASHDPIGGVEGLLDAIAMVDIDINIKDSGMEPMFPVRVVILL